jgi:hypothetical protein
MITGAGVTGPGLICAGSELGNGVGAGAPTFDSSVLGGGGGGGGGAAPLLSSGGRGTLAVTPTGYVDIADR